MNPFEGIYQKDGLPVYPCKKCGTPLMSEVDNYTGICPKCRKEHLAITQQKVMPIPKPHVVNDPMNEQISPKFGDPSKIDYFTLSNDPFESAWDSIAKFDEDYLERPELESDPHWVMGGISDDLAFDDPNNLDCIEKVRRFLMAISYEGYMRTKDDPASGELWDHYANQPAEHLEAFLRQYNFPSHQVALQMLEDCREAKRRELAGEGDPSLPPLHFSQFLDPKWRFPE